MFYERILRALLERKIRFAVTGGVALVLYGIARFTADLDLILDLRSDNLQKFIDMMKEWGFKPRVPAAPEDLMNPGWRARWVEEKNMVAFTFYNPAHELEEVDIFIKEYIPFDEVERELKRMIFKDISIPVVSLNHLKRLKELASRPQDLADLEAIKTLEELKNE
jgi:hypothetical protein